MRENKSLADEILAKPIKLAAFIDHTLLKPVATAQDIEQLCREASQYAFRAVCVNPDRVALAKTFLKNTTIASVVGFPLGSHISAIKAYETELAVNDGATEIDMVLNIGWLKEKLFKKVGEDIRAVVSAAGLHPVKVIFETGLLETSEIKEACKISEDAGARFVKTSTGFLGRGASLEDVQIMSQNISEKMQIKASGGIKDIKFACELIAAGATRIGTSSGVQLVQALPAKSGY